MTGDSAPGHWIEWHRGYDVEDGPLARRLAIVQRQVERAIVARRRDQRPIRILSLCSGDGRDLIGPVARTAAGRRVQGRLIELDEHLAGDARTAITSAGLGGLEVRQGDAGITSAYAGAVPADLLLVCGVFGNISDADIERTVRALPTLCAEGATVIWTRHRREPDRTPAIRRWFRAAGFRHRGFFQVADSPSSVGVERFVGTPEPFRDAERLFEFVDA
jgi:hypothetical protein